MSEEWRPYSIKDLLGQNNQNNKYKGYSNGYVCVSQNKDGLLTPHNCFSSLLKLKGLFSFGQDLFSLNNLNDIGGFQAKLTQKLATFTQDCQDIFLGVCALFIDRKTDKPQGIDNLSAENLDWAHALVVMQDKKMYLVFPEGEEVAYYIRGADGNFWRCDESGNLCAHNVAEVGKTQCMKFGCLSLAEIANHASEFAGRFILEPGKGLQPAQETDILTTPPTQKEAKDIFDKTLHLVSKTVDEIKNMDWENAQLYTCNKIGELMLKIGNDYYKKDAKQPYFIQIDQNGNPIKEEENYSIIQLSDIQTARYSYANIKNIINEIFDQSWNPLKNSAKVTDLPGDELVPNAIQTNDVVANLSTTNSSFSNSSASSAFLTVSETDITTPDRSGLEVENEQKKTPLNTGEHVV